MPLLPSQVLLGRLGLAAPTLICGGFVYEHDDEGMDEDEVCICACADVWGWGWVGGWVGGGQSCEGEGYVTMRARKKILVCGVASSP